MYVNQPDALFIFSLFHHYTSTRFGLLVAHHKEVKMYRVIHKSLRDVRPLQYSSRTVTPKGSMSTEGETVHVNRGRDSACQQRERQCMSTEGETVQVLCYLTGAR
jgi:hypothetical protein